MSTVSKLRSNIFYALQPISLQLPDHLCTHGVSIVAHSPSGLERFLKVKFRNGFCYIDFLPNEIGEWTFMTSSSSPPLLQSSSSSPIPLRSSPPSRTSLSSSPTPSLPSASPFKARVFDGVGVSVVTPLEGIVGEDVCFIVDSSEAKDCKRVTMKVKMDNSEIATEINTNKISAIYECYFHPVKACDHYLHVNYAGRAVMGSPYKISIHGNTQLRVVLNQDVNSARVNRSCHLDILFNRLVKREDLSDINVVIRGPQNREKDIQALTYTPDRTNNQTIRVSFVPITVGDHIITVHHQNTPVLATPITCGAYDPNEVDVVYVQKVTYVDKKCIFDVDTSKAGKGDLEVSIDNGATNHHMEDLGNGLYRVSLVIRDVRKHKVDVKFNGERVPGCPFVMFVKLTTEIVAKSKPFMKRKSYFEVKVTGLAGEEPRVRVIGPSGKKADVSLVEKMTNGNYRIEYCPNEEGDHELLIENDLNQQTNQSTTTSPTLNFDTTNDSASLGEGSSLIEEDVLYAAVNQKSRFSLIGRWAEIVKLAISFEALKSRRSVKAKVRRQNPDMNEDVCEVVFATEEIGDYRGDLEYDGVKVGQVPFKVKSYDVTQVKVTGLGEERERGEKREVGKDLKVDEEASFVVDATDAGEGNLLVSIEMGNNRNYKIPTHVDKLSNSRFKVKYTPRSPGSYKVNVLFNERFINGNPFFFNVLDQSKINLKPLLTNNINLNNPEALLLDAEDCDVNDVEAYLIEPANRKFPVRVLPTMSANEIALCLKPATTGTHVVEAFHKKKLIPGFPKKLFIYDPNKVKVNLKGSFKVDQAIIVEVDKKNAGEGQIEVKVTESGQRVVFEPIAVNQSQNRYDFIPTKKGLYLIDVLFNKVSLPGSPFKQRVSSDEAKIKFEGQRVLEVNKMSTFHLRIPEEEMEEGSKVVVEVTDDSGNRIPYQLTKTPPDLYTLTLKPEKAGQIKASVNINGSEVKENEVMYFKVIDPTKIYVRKFPLDVMLGDTVKFLVDTSHSGQSNIQVEVDGATSHHNATVTTQQRNESNKIVNFVPTEAGKHFIRVLCEGRTVPGSPYTCNVSDINEIKADWPSIQCIPVNQPVNLAIQHNMLSSSHLFSADITDPKGSKVDSSILPHQPSSPHRNSAQRILVNFTPEKLGQYKINLTYLGHQLNGSPGYANSFDDAPTMVNSSINSIDNPNSNDSLNNHVQFSVAMATTGVMTHTPLTSSLSTQTNRKVDYSQARVVVTAPNGHEIQAKLVQEMNGTPKVDFNSPYGGKHKIEVILGANHILNSPYFTNVIQPSLVNVVSADHKWTLGEQVDYEVSTVDAGNAELSLEIKDPRGTSVDFKVMKMENRGEGGDDGEIQGEDDDYGGEGVIGKKLKNNVKYNRSLSPSRNTISFTDSDSRIETKNKNNIINSKNNSFRGKSEGLVGEGFYRVLYRPIMEGPHRSYVRYNGLPVSRANPLIQDVIAPSKATSTGGGLGKGVVGETARFMVDGGSKKGDLIVQVTGPNSVAKVNIEPISSGSYNVAYDPLEVGHYQVFVKWNGRNVEGSPFQPIITDPTKVKFIGGYDKLVDPVSKVMNLKLGQVNKIELNTSPAGPGTLTAELLHGNSFVEGLEVYEDGEKGVFVVVVLPMREGDHMIRILLDKNLIPHCPIRAFVKKPPQRSLVDLKNSTSNQINANKVIVSGKGLKEAYVDQRAEFIIDGTDSGHGIPTLRLIGIKGEMRVEVTPINQNLSANHNGGPDPGGGIYRCVYRMKKAGSYLLYIHWSDKAITGSPFKVVAKATSDVTKVVCSGDGLKKGILGEDIRAFIDCRDSEAGSLKVTCMGKTSRATSTLIEQGNQTYKLLLRPVQVGKHSVEILYNGVPVNGSPFQLKVSSPPDASSVKVYGPGVEKGGRVGEFKGHFFADTSGAGAGELVVRVKGPKGSFCVEMQRNKLQHRLITCRYDPLESGEYLVQVKWSGVNVTGSPFKVLIV